MVKPEEENNMKKQSDYSPSVLYIINGFNMEVFLTNPIDDDSNSKPLFFFFKKSNIYLQNVEF